MSSELSLHKAVFSGDFDAVERIVKSCDPKRINNQDIHGNTALHIAVMKGDRRCVELLVKSGATTNIRNELNWMSLHEAISYGDFQIIKILNDELSRRMAQFLNKDFIIEHFNDIEEDFVAKFEVRIKEFNPSTIVRHPELKICLTKKGTKMRADVDVTDCFRQRPEKFNVFFDFSPNSQSFMKITVADLPVYQTVTFDHWEQSLRDIFFRESLDQEIRAIMQKENVSIKLDRDSTYSQKPMFRKSSTRKVCGYKTDIYQSQGVDLITKTRTEHLRAMDGIHITDSESLPPPEARDVSWDQYISAPKGKFPYLGRKAIESIQAKRVSLVFGITNEISFDWTKIMSLAEKILNHKIVHFLEQVVHELPQGFPVVVDFPIKHSLYLKWKLISLSVESVEDDSVFAIPDHYVEQNIFHVERADASLT